MGRESGGMFEVLCRAGGGRLEYKGRVTRRKKEVSSKRAEAAKIVHSEGDQC